MTMLRQVLLVSSFLLAVVLTASVPLAHSWSIDKDGSSTLGVVGSWSDTGKALLLQNRDLDWPNPGQIVKRMDGDGFSFIVETTLPYGGTGQRLNERGIAMVGTGPHDTKASSGDMSSTKISDAVMQQASSLEQAYTVMAGLVSSQGISGGGYTWIIANATAIMGIEAAGHSIAHTQVLTDGFIVYTNHFNLLTDLNGKITDCSRLRYDRISLLTNEIRKLSIDTMMNRIARDTTPLENQDCSVNITWANNQGGTTASGVLVPASDSSSVMWVTLGHPTSAIYTPVFFGTKIPTEMQEGTFFKMSESLRTKNSVTSLGQLTIVEDALFEMINELAGDRSVQRLDQIEVAARNMVLGKYVELGASRIEGEYLLSIDSISNSTNIDGIKYVFPSSRIVVSLNEGIHEIEVPSKIGISGSPTLTFNGWGDDPDAKNMRTLALTQDTSLRALYGVSESTPTTSSASETSLTSLIQPNVTREISAFYPQIGIAITIFIVLILVVVALRLRKP
jgi:hypothetical protein